MITKDKQHGKKSQVKCRTNLSLMREGIIKGKGFHVQVMIINLSLMREGIISLVQVQCFLELLGTLQTLTLSGGALFLLVRTQGAHKLKEDNNRS